MEKHERIQFLENLRKETPDDPFVWYALLLELGPEMSDSGIERWKEMMAKFPEYLPLYYQFGKALVAENQIQAAVDVFSLGIELAQKLNDGHALSELKSARMNALLEE